MRGMTEEEIVRSFEEAIREGQFSVWYQPQYNHSTGRLVGAEGLMRWDHPQFGPQYPEDFIPVLEKHGFIHQADLQVFDQICRFQSSCPPSVRVPISFNVSRCDLLGHDYVSELEAIRERYQVPVKYLRAEITESATVGGLELVAAALDQFHAAGYLVEMDDFGSGYSSLSILKSLPVDVLKLDLRFLASEGLGGRGGIILNSVIQMAKWLETQTVAEGVETLEQADFLKSVGCNYVQGYLYSKPIPQEEMRALLDTCQSEETAPALKFIREMKAQQFWDPNSLETFIFNNYIGAAAIFSYAEGHLEMLRVNKKYIEELGMNLTESEILAVDPLPYLTPENREIYLATLKRAVQSGEEESCETWREIHSECCGEDKVCIRSQLRVIGSAGEQAVFYTIIKNVTGEKRSAEELAASERRFRFASEQANVYAWEYTVDTKEMRPCFRCMRDLGLPPLVRNYPEPAIAAGIFPADYADMYRDWHRQIAAGAKELEAVIPLTVGRVPFHVRYTTEFDENGKPLKAYGSATLVVDEPLQSSATVYTHIAHALARGYTDLYYVNLETAEFIEFHTDDERGVLTEARRGTDFFGNCERDAKIYVHREDQAAFVEAMDRDYLNRALEGNQVFELTYRRLIDGKPIYVQMKVSRMEDDRRFVVIAVSDIDELTRQRREEERVKEERAIYARLHAITGNFIVIYEVDPETGNYREFTATEDYIESFAQAREGTDFFGQVREAGPIFNHPEDQERFDQAFTRENVLDEIGREGIFTLGYRFLREGKYIYVQLKAALVEEKEGPRLMVGLYDVDTQVRQEMETSRRLIRAQIQASVDALTGVKNRHAFLESEVALDKQITKYGQARFAIVMLDVNDLKKVNDTAGHQAGDQYLQEACKVICGVFRHSPVFRVGGDEFAVIAQDSDYEHLDELVERLAAHNAQAKETGGVVVACGAARFDRDPCVANVFERADQCMYEDKNRLKTGTR